MKENIKWFNSPYNLAEESQATGIVFSFLSEDNIQCHPWVKCRDFLQDAVCATVTKTPASIYGFKFDVSKKENPPVRLDKTVMLVSKADLLNIDDSDTPLPSLLSFDKKMKSAIKLVNYYEDVARVSRSNLTKHKEGKTWYWKFEGPAFWMKSPALVSMYSYLIRLGDKEIEFSSSRELLDGYKELMSTAMQDKDVSYLAVCWNKLYLVARGANKILLEGGEIDKDYNDKVTVSRMHSKGGIRSLCSSPCVYINETKAVELFKGVV